MTDVSFLLPTARSIEHPAVLKTCLDGIRNTQGDMNYEILVYSRERVEGENIKWIKEDGVRGPIYGFNHLASTHAKGDYLVCLTDDHLINNSISLCIDNIETNLHDRKYKLSGLSPGGSCYIPPKGAAMGTGVIEEDLPRAPLLRFPVIRKDALELLGGYIFHPDLFYHAGDIWLGYFLYMQGEAAIEGPTSISQITPLKNSQFEVSDCDIAYRLIKSYISGNTEYVSEKRTKE